LVPGFPGDPIFSLPIFSISFDETFSKSFMQGWQSGQMRQLEGLVG
jgi:hypothetical protein